MPLSLLEAAKLAPTAQAETIIEEFGRTSDVLRVLGWDNILGGAKAYNREEELPGVGFRGLNEQHEESVGVINPATEALKLAGGDLDVDRFILDSQGENVRSVHEMMKVKSLSLAWTRNFIKGDSRINPRVFDGLQVRLTGSQLLHNAESGGPLSLSKVDELIDAVDNPNFLLVSKNVRRKLTAAVRAGIGGDIETEKDEFGRVVTLYSGLPLLVLDYDNRGSQILSFTETSEDGTNPNCTSIYAVNFGPKMLTGIQGAVNGEYGISVRDLGELNDRPVKRTRVDWYTSICLEHGRCAARLAGITDGAVVA